MLAALLASADTAKVAYIIAAILFVICAIVSAVDKSIVWCIGFVALAAVAFGLHQSITP